MTEVYLAVLQNLVRRFYYRSLAPACVHATRRRPESSSVDEARKHE